MVRAFSLLELMIVIAMIGVMSAAAFPALSQMTRASKNTEDVMLAGLEISKARDLARNSRGCVEFAVEGTGPFALLTRPVPCPTKGGGTGTVVLKPGAKPAAGQKAAAATTVTLPPTITELEMHGVDGACSGEPITSLTFDRDGTLIKPFGTISVVVAAGGVARELRVYPVAGAVVTR